MFHYFIIARFERNKKEEKKNKNGLTLRSIDLLTSPAAFWRRGPTTKNTGLSNSKDANVRPHTIPW